MKANKPQFKKQLMDDWKPPYKAKTSPDYSTQSFGKETSHGLHLSNDPDNYFLPCFDLNQNVKYLICS